jgi:flagellar hook-associated protein 3 FlgL
MNDIDTADDGRSLQSLTLSESLASLRETNYAEAISRLNMHLLALEAAQKTMLQTQGMSLFNKL